MTVYKFFGELNLLFERKTNNFIEGLYEINKFVQLVSTYVFYV